MEFPNGIHLKRSFHFLGKHIYQEHVWRPWNETYAILLYPEYPTPSVETELLVAYGHFLDCGNNYTKLMLHDYVNFLKDSYRIISISEFDYNNSARYMLERDLYYNGELRAFLDDPTVNFELSISVLYGI